jgi:hypothetical protein
MAKRIVKILILFKKRKIHTFQFHVKTFNYLSLYLILCVSFLNTTFFKPKNQNFFSFLNHNTPQIGCSSQLHLQVHFFAHDFKFLTQILCIWFQDREVWIVIITHESQNLYVSSLLLMCEINYCLSILVI